MSNYCISCQREYQTEAAFCPICGLKLQDKPLESQRRDELIGRCIEGRYTILEKLGAGGMGMVYRGVQKSVDRPIAIKMLRKELAETPEVIGRFLHEAKVASSLTHPNTVSVFDFGQMDDGLLFLIMELLKGKPLSKVLRSETLALRDTLSFVSQMCSAMEEAHQLGIIHRDLKPENIFIVEVANRRYVKVLDFGIAKVLDTHTCLTQTGQIFGTPAYMSPEQSRGKKLTTQSDIYSLGTIMYEMLSGRQVFHAQTPVGLLMKHIHDEPIPLTRLEPAIEVPASLERLVLKMLEKAPQNRPQTMHEVGEEVEHILANEVQGKNSFTSTEPNIARMDMSGQPIHRVVTQPGFATEQEYPVVDDAVAGTDGNELRPSFDSDAAAIATPEVLDGTNQRDRKSPAVIQPSVEISSDSGSTDYPYRRSRSRTLTMAAAVAAALLITVVLVIATRQGDEPGDSTSSEESTQQVDPNTADAVKTIVIYPISERAASTISDVYAGLTHLLTINLTSRPRAEVTVVDSGRLVGTTPVSLNLMVEHGPFRLTQKGHEDLIVHVGQLRPGLNEVELQRKGKGVVRKDTPATDDKGDESTKTGPDDKTDPTGTDSDVNYNEWGPE